VKNNIYHTEIRALPWVSISVNMIYQFGDKNETNSSCSDNVECMYDSKVINIREIRSASFLIT